MSGTRRAILAMLGILVLVWDPVLAQEDDPTGDVPAPVRRAIEQVEEVTVTARKREERLEDTPVSVTALNEATLRDAGAVRLDQVGTLAPNLQFLTARTGQEAQPYIRGVGQLDQVITTDPGVGIYVDGVFLSRAQGTVVRLFDVERVEVLRGPQGTLFGKNTAGGAITLTTIKPRNELEAILSVRPGNYDSVESRFTLNTPIALGGMKDKLFARITGITANSEGYTRNSFRDEHASDTNALGMMGALRFLPIDDLDLNLTGMWFRDHSRSKGGQCVFVQPPPNPFVTLPDDFEQKCRATRPYTFQGDTHSIADIESYGTWGTATWSAGEVGALDDLTIKSITSWREQIPRVREDLDMTEYDLVSIASAGGGEFEGAPGFARQVSQEFQGNVQAALPVLDGRVTAVGGLYGFWEEASLVEATRALPDAPQFVQELGAPTFQRDVDADNSSYAVYGQTTIDLMNSLSLTGGFRWTTENKEFSTRVTNLRLPESSPSHTLLNASDEKSFEDWTPMASVAYRVPEVALDWLNDLPLYLRPFYPVLALAPYSHFMPYFTYSEGFKSGGFNGNARLGVIPGSVDPYDPENVRSYEIGLKTISFNKRVGLNFAAFMSDYSNIQVIATRSNPQVPLIVDRITLNAAEASIRGIETEMEVRPFTGMNLVGSIGLLDTEYDEFTDAVDGKTGETTDRTGQSFNSVPSITTNLIAQYTMPVDLPGPTWMSGWITPRLRYYYQDAVNYIGPELPEARQGGYGLLDGRLSYDFHDDRAQIALWSNNITNEKYFGAVLSGITSTIGHLVRYYDAPRTFGAELTYRF